MATQITIDKILPPNSDYPITDIIVDTNVIIDYKDPFGNVNPNVNSKIVDQINKLKSHFKVYSTIISAIEYYKFLQYGYYNIYIKIHSGNYAKYSTIEFKKLRRTDPDFSNGWDLRLKEFKRTNIKHFPPLNIDLNNIYTIENIGTFDGSKADFGDEMIYKICQFLKFPVVITKDKDFSSFPDDLNLLIL